ncbi:MAG: aldo/keto reductase, partial [Spirochaetaceae bacterium]|nr:aldo/keto reductase [Spirochaetaceae bacterium]
MNMLNVVNGPHNVSRIILGCMRMPNLSVEKAAGMIRSAADLGINFFDHATCYGDGEAERRFGDAFPLTGLKRENVII